MKGKKDWRAVKENKDKSFILFKHFNCFRELSVEAKENMKQLEERSK